MTRRNLPDDEIAAFLARPLVATLATYRKDGSVLLSPVWQEWRDGGFNIIVGRGDVKARSIARDPRASVAVYESDPPYTGVELRATARILDDDPHALTRRLAIRYMGAARGEDYARATAGDAQLWLRLEPGDLRSWDYKDLWPPD
jgi:PPOX class probable F420-dependent enzyme